MKIIIAGSRDFNDYSLLIETMSYFGGVVTEVVSGTAPGADALGEQWANEIEVKITRFKPDWEQLGKFAGIKRNREMADYADMLVAFWDRKSKGTKNMINEMVSRNKPVLIQSYNN